MGFELTTVMVIGTDCTGSCKSNYHTISTTTVPSRIIFRRKSKNIGDRFGAIKLVKPHPFLLKFLYQAREVNSDVFVLGLYILSLSTIFFIGIALF